MNLLKFADDLIIIAKVINEVTDVLNDLERNCENIRLRINIEKAGTIVEERSCGT